MSNVKSDVWDVIIIGTGMGGGAAGYWLAKHGLKVLFLEKGLDTHRFLDSSSSNANPHYQFRLAAGWWPTRLRAEVDNQSPSDIFRPLGCGVGGSTAHFGGTLERFDPIDFSPSGQYELPSDITGDGKWPFNYNDLLPYYEIAETLLGKASDSDVSEQYSEVDKHFYESFQSSGLTPYRQPLSASKYKVTNGILMGTKVGSREAFVLPAINNYGATLLEQCDVRYLIGNVGEITGVVYEHSGTMHNAMAKNVILAAGAFNSPAIILRSIEHDPQVFNKLNGFEQVGKNLMFHLDCYFALWPNRKMEKGARVGKNLALRDFYILEGYKGGSIQSLGMQAGRSVIAMSLNTLLEENGIKKIPQKLIKCISIVAEKVFGRSEMFTCMIEDFPYHYNSVTLDKDSPSGIKVRYYFADELKLRAAKIRKKIKRSFQKHRMFIIDRKPRLNFGHPCGTLRAGVDPKNSVVDASCKFFGMENLFVVDSSIFSSSGGVNPSLTVAANAIRVASNLTNDLDIPPSVPIESEFGPFINMNNIPEPMSSLIGCVVVITGAGSGLGQSLSLHLCKMGAKVVGVGRREKPLLKTLELAGENFDFKLANVISEDGVKDVMGEINTQYGSIDVLINNAAVYTKETLELNNISQWWSSFEINVKGPLICSLAALPYMTVKGRGRIVNIGSFADRLPLPGSTSYSVSKGALHTLTISLSSERDGFAHKNISIFEYVPGPMQTQMGSAVGDDPAKFCSPLAELIVMPSEYTNGKIFTWNNYRPVKVSLFGKLRRIIGKVKNKAISVIS